MIHDRSLLQARPYFMHYLFETYARRDRADRFFEALTPWHGLVRDGMKTTPEHFQDGRSDCHAWSAHPAYHFLTSVAGIRPDAMGFAKVAIRPQPGPLTALHATLDHPCGPITLELTPRRAVIESPSGVEGTFSMGSARQPLTSGSQTVGLR